MAKYSYATKDGKMKSIEAKSASEAQALVRSLADAAKGTGVMLDTGVQPVIQNNKVDVSKVKTGVKPFDEPKVDLKTTLIRTEERPDGTATNYYADGRKVTGSYVKEGKITRFVESPSGSSTKPTEFQDPKAVDTPAPTTPAAPTTPTDPKSQLLSRRNTLEGEISTLEQRILTRSERRQDALDDAGVFDDMRQLNKYKDELREIEDREVEIPIESRQRLRGRQATKTEFKADTRPELEDNLLKELAASRKVSRMTDVINTNLEIINDRFEAEKERDEFLHETKMKRLEKIETLYGNIITEEQKAALEDRKFQQSLLLESVKADNTLRSNLITEIAKKGVGGQALSGLMTASIDELVNHLGSTTSAANWGTMTPDEAARTLSSEDFDRYLKFKEFQAKGDEAAQEQLTAAIGKQQTAKSTVDLVTSLLNDKEGLTNSVGFGTGSWDFSIFGAGNETAGWRAKAKQLMSATTLNTLQELKSTGATLGSVTEKELQILATAGNALAPILDKNGNATGRFKMKEEDFVEVLQTMRLASMRTYIAASIGKEAFAAANYLNADYDTVEKRYQDLVANGTKPQGNFYQNDRSASAVSTAAEVIRREEGLRTEAYRDSTGTWTIGYGNTTINGRPVQPGDRLTPAQAENLMRESVVTNYTEFADQVTRPITDQQFAALTSFEYNLGSGVWSQPTGRQILAAINAGDLSTAGRLMLQYNKARNPATGQLEVNPVLAKRRAREASMLVTA